MINYLLKGFLMPAVMSVGLVGNLLSIRVLRSPNIDMKVLRSPNIDMKVEILWVFLLVCVETAVNFGAETPQYNWHDNWLGPLQSVDKKSTRKGFSQQIISQGSPGLVQDAKTLFCLFLSKNYFSVFSGQIKIFNFEVSHNEVSENKYQIFGSNQPLAKSIVVFNCLQNKN